MTKVLLSRHVDMYYMLYHLFSTKKIPIIIKYSICIRIVYILRPIRPVKNYFTKLKIQPFNIMNYEMFVVEKRIVQIILQKQVVHRWNFFILIPHF